MQASARERCALVLIFVRASPILSQLQFPSSELFLEFFRKRCQKIVPRTHPVMSQSTRAYRAA